MCIAPHSWQSRVLYITWAPYEKFSCIWFPIAVINMGTICKVLLLLVPYLQSLTWAPYVKLFCIWFLICSHLSDSSAQGKYQTIKLQVCTSFLTRDTEYSASFNNPAGKSSNFTGDTFFKSAE